MQKNEEQAKENFMLYMPMFGIHDDEIKMEEIFYTDHKKCMQIKKELKAIVLTEGKDYVVKNQNYTCIQITLESTNTFPIVVRKHSPIEPLNLVSRQEIELKKAIRNIFEKLSHEKS